MASVASSCFAVPTPSSRSSLGHRRRKPSPLGIWSRGKAYESFFMCTGSNRLGMQPHRLNSSSQELSSELVDDPKFVPLNADDPQYGPPALLLLGFGLEETDKIRNFLRELDSEFLKIIHCTADMINSSLWEAVNTDQPALENVKVAKNLPRICFLSGLTGEEMSMFVDSFPEIGLEPTLFAALVPNSANKPLEELIDEIVGDHERLTADT